MSETLSSPFAPDLLRGKRVLITGGGTGLGAAMAGRFAELGASLVICGRRQAVLEDTARSIAAATGAEVTPIPCDIRIPDTVEAMLDTAWTTGPVDVLINNAGALFVAQTERLSARAFDAVLAPSLHGAIYCTLGVGRRWIDSGRRGVVLSILSTSTITGRAFTAPTTVSKAGLLALTRSLAVEWASRGIRVVAIAPGSFPTQGYTEHVRAGRGAHDPAWKPNPLDRVGSPPELANLASYLISDAADYINGEMVTIDGGRHLRNSGVEDLLAWTDERWEEQRNARRK
jgi:NAD(P)-dependent dehydrogenase (short-subunit alcohol dehydrogenase family)